MCEWGTLLLNFLFLPMFILSKSLITFLSAFHQPYIDNTYPDEDVCFIFPIIKFFIYYLFIYVCLSFFQPWWCSINNQREIGTEIFRITGKQNINHAVFSIELTVSEMLQWLSVNRDVTKSLLPANFTHQKRPYHQLKLFWKAKTWSHFKRTVEWKRHLDL